MDAEAAKTIIKQEVENVVFRSVNDDDALLEQNILDSVGAVDLAVALEGAFGISIPFVDINKQHFQSVLTLLEYVQKKTA
ncbi:MAG: acyl carrier protein [Flavobacteriales bacterium]|nr:MAG: acyl carrier protein [Flavobacteriales bacterium]